MKNLFLIVLVIVVAAVAMSLYSQLESHVPQTDGPATGDASNGQPKSPEEIRQDKIDSLFSMWDGSNETVVKAVKAGMNDPDSFEHVETNFWDMKDHLVVKMTYRGKNAFGGVVTNVVRAEIDLSGRLLKLDPQ